jgi:hypothetical protein
MGERFYWIGDRCIAFHRMRGPGWIGWGCTPTRFGDAMVYAFWIGSWAFSFTKPKV